MMFGCSHEVLRNEEYELDCNEGIVHTPMRFQQTTAPLPAMEVAVW